MQSWLIVGQLSEQASFLTDNSLRGAAHPHAAASVLRRHVKEDQIQNSHFNETAQASGSCGIELLCADGN